MLQACPAATQERTSLLLRVVLGVDQYFQQGRGRAHQAEDEAPKSGHVSHIRSQAQHPSTPYHAIVLQALLGFSGYGAWYIQSFAVWTVQESCLKACFEAGEKSPGGKIHFSRSWTYARWTDKGKKDSTAQKCQHILRHVYG